ncbi:MAG TPA: APC family permease [Fibrobacteria bacterium]|nr:APC family permease [Fibrobacteria bacterium]
MSPLKRTGFLEKLKRLTVGRSLDPTSPQTFHNLSLIAFFAWVGLGADGLSSASYGPEEAFRVLIQHPHLGLLVALGSALTVLIISASYTHLIELFPAGGGGYLVASKLLGPKWGMVSGCALIIDYVLTIAISVASGAAAIFSFLPAEWLPYKIPFAMAALCGLILLNLRGAKESVLPLVPVFLVFIFTHVFAIVYGMAGHLWELPALVRDTAAETGHTYDQLGFVGIVLLLLRSYSMGAGTYTGIEAVSNGMPILREPRVQTGKRTMLYMATSLSFMVLGLMICYVFFKIQPVEGKTLNAVFFETLTSGWSPGSSRAFVWVSLFTEAAILFVAAQAGFLGGPRVLANMALDQWFPTRFTLLSDRLVSQNGVLLMGILAGAVLLLTGASVHYLVVLYSITVFITFVLSQAGLVKHWWATRGRTPHWKRRLLTATTALALCSFILVVVTILKFFEGGWITLLALVALVGLALLAKRHYASVTRTLKKMDSLVQAAKASQGSMAAMSGTAGATELKYDPKAKTAVMLVSGFDGPGLHTLFSIIRLFGGIYKNFIFVEIGLIDAGNFKGEEEVEHLKAHVKDELDKYVEFTRRHGYYAESVTLLSHDPVEGCARLAPGIIERFPQSVFFMGQLVFPEESWVSRLFHNNTVFAVQRRLYHLGIPFLILPIRVKLRD